MGIDKGNTNAAVMAFDSIYGIHYPSASGQEGNGNAVHWDYQIQATPSLVVIIPDRSIAVKQIYPPSTQNVVDSVINVGGVLQECLTALDENKSGELFTLYPNPAEDFLILDFNNGFDFQTSIVTIRNVLGQIEESSFIAGKTDDSILFDTASLERGLYFVFIITDKNEHLIRKFIKN